VKEWPDPYTMKPFIPPFHLLNKEKLYAQHDLHPDPPRERDMDADILAAIRANTDAITELVAELRRMVDVLQRPQPVKRRPGYAGQVRDDVGLGGGEVPRATWLTPIEEAYEKEMGAGSFPLGSALKPLAQLRKKGNTEHEIARRLGYYVRHLVRANETQYASIPHFAKTFATWDPAKPAFDDED